MDDVWRLLAQTGDCVWVVDACGRIVHWNPAAHEALGYGASEVSGQSCHQCMAGADVGRMCVLPGRLSGHSTRAARVPRARF